MRNKIIIGITGTLGAGKGAIVDYLKKKGFKHYSVREFLIGEIKKRGLPVNRDSMVIVGNDLRKKYGPSYLAEELCQQAEQDGKYCIIESIRTPGEITALKAKGDCYIFAIDADPKLRYERIMKRNTITDQISFEEFMANERREMSSDDPNKQNLSQCISMSDYKFDNSGTFDDLYKQVDQVLLKIKSN